VRVDDYSDPMGALLRDKIFGGSALRKQKHKEELEHERALAAIRSEPRGLVWNGTQEEFTATITRLYESGAIEAESPEDALRKAALHFVICGGRSPKVVPAEMSAKATKRQTTIRVLPSSFSK